jgi:hypothetical protein
MSVSDALEMVKHLVAAQNWNKEATTCTPNASEGEYLPFRRCQSLNHETARVPQLRL